MSVELILTALSLAVSVVSLFLLRAARADIADLKARVTALQAASEADFFRSGLEIVRR